MALSSQESGQVAQAGAWDLASDGYKMLKDWTLTYGKHGLEQIKLQPGARLLEVACGPGLLAMHAAQELQASVHAIDFSPAMVSALKENMKGAGTHLDITACVMDGTALDYPDACFDAIASVFGVFLFPQDKRGLAEMYRVTRPGGACVVVSWAQWPRTPGGPWLALMERDFPEGLPLPEMAGVRAMQTTEGMITSLGAAGFKDVCASEYSASMEMADPLQYMKPMEHNPFFQEIKPRFSEERWQAMFEAMPSFLREKYAQDDGKIVLSATAIIGVGHR